MSSERHIIIDTSKIKEDCGLEEEDAIEVGSVINITNQENDNFYEKYREEEELKRIALAIVNDYKDYRAQVISDNREYDEDEAYHSYTRRSVYENKSRLLRICGDEAIER